MGNIRTILIAEDDENDFLLIHRALKKAGFRGAVVRAADGTEAIHRLEQIGDQETPLPALALIDLKMPRKDGFDVLRWKRKHSELPCVPMIIFSSSGLERDVKEAYALGAHSYTTKPGQFEQYVRYCEALQGWWCHCEFING
jgi:CheY-like chemotaxis protein